MTETPETNPTDLATQKQIVLDFIAAQSLGVFCTINADGLPEAATMAFSENQDLQLVFQTPNTTRKYANLQKDPHIAVVIGWSLDDFITVQYEGTVREVTDDEERQTLSARHAAKNPASAAYVTIPENKFFVITPTKIIYSAVKNGQKFVLDF